MQIKQEKLTRLEGELNDQKYWIEIEGALLTPVFRDALNKSGEQPLLLAGELSQRIKNWNLYLKEEGDLLPTEESIAHLPDEVVYSLVDTVSQVWSADKKK